MNEVLFYHDRPGYYEAISDDTFYCDQCLREASCWKIKKGQQFYLEDIVKVGKNIRAKVRLNNDIQYCTMRNDYWKLLYLTERNKIK